MLEAGIALVITVSQCACLESPPQRAGGKVWGELSVAVSALMSNLKTT